MSEVNFDPVNGRVLIERKKGEVYDKTKSGLFLPKAQPGQDQHGVVGFVVSFDETDDHALNKSIKVGSKVVYNHLAANEYKETPDSKPYYIVMKDTILLVYKDGK